MCLNKFTIQKSFAISAGAGSGKTYTLSRRYINALLGFDYFREDYKTQESFFSDSFSKSAKVNQIVTITYTEAAALEMKGRIFELVSKIINPNLSSSDGDYSSIVEANNHITKNQQEYVQKTLNHAFKDGSNSKISTIHSFCLDIIKTNSDIAKIDTKLDMIKEDEKAKELSTIIFDVLNDKSNQNIVLEISKDVSMFFLNNLINKYVSNTKFRTDYDSFKKNSIDLIDYKKIMFELYPLPDITDVLIELNDDPVRLQWFKKFYQNYKNFDAQIWKDVDTNSKAPTMGIKKFPISDPIKKELENGTILSIYSEINIEKEDIFFDKIDKIKGLLHQIKNKYDERLIVLGKIDFDTIITKTLEIIPKVNTNFKYIMVDEFQDTNASQFEIVKNAMNQNTNLFVVGDSKQSIYSFQGAEIEVFNTAVKDTTYFSSIEDMSQNYRSDEAVLDNVNKIFQHLLKPNDNLKLISQNYEAQAQDLHTKSKGGSFKYLITSQEYKEELSELDTIASFVSELYHNTNSDYAHISKLIANKEKAIAIIFDSSTKMLELKQKLRAKGITAKVSASNNFYHTKEINDIFNVLKAIDILSSKKTELSKSQRYYIAGAMRSNILRIDDNTVKKYLDTDTIPENLTRYVEVFKILPLSQAVKFIYDDSNIQGVYAHFDDIEQRVANLYKFLILCRDYENSDESNLYTFLSLLENSIYFSEAKEDEAFFKSDNTKSIEICTIHATKGLAYPLVLLGNSDKSLYKAITSDALKHNNFTLNGEKKEIVGFKINDYTPLSHRVLKQIDKLKHLAEKKRLLYVALTRAEHDVVISAHLKQTAQGLISLGADSYLHMICEALEIDVDELYGHNEKYCLQINEDTHNNILNDTVEYIKHSLLSLEFKSKSLDSATKKSEIEEVIYKDNSAARLGTTTHEIIESYWDKFQKNQEVILDKKEIFDITDRVKIISNMQVFYTSDVYDLLKNGVEHHFELEFNTDGKTGFIDFIYFNKVKDGWVIIDFKTGIGDINKNKKYQEQLDFYEEVMIKLGYKVVGSELLWLSE